MTLTREEQRLTKIVSRLEGELYEARHQINLHRADTERAERVVAEYQDKLERQINKTMNLTFRLDQNNKIMVSLHQAWERCNTVIELLEGAALERWIEGHDPQEVAKHLSLLAQYVKDTPIGDKYQPHLAVHSELVRNIFEELMSDESVEQEEEATSGHRAVNTELVNTELF